jgi:antitoxin (DNA-binding transcriptional repressor) of toxin-antitoxin stability system
MENISMSEARSRFSEHLSRAAGSERFVILRRQRPLAAIIGVEELVRLERYAEITRRLAHSLGQSGKLLDQVEAGKAHPAMAAFGLWKDEEDLAGLEEIVRKNRQSPSSIDKIARYGSLCYAFTRAVLSQCSCFP